MTGDGGEGGAVIAYAAVSDARVTPGTLRSHVMAHLDRWANVVCPSRFVVCGGVPARNGEAFWRRLEVLHDGDGLDRSFRPPCGAAESALQEPVMNVNGVGKAPLPATYQEVGGKLAKAPLVIRALRSVGYSGLAVEDFRKPVSLAQLAARLVWAEGDGMNGRGI